MATGTGRRDHSLAASRKPREQTEVGHSYELSDLAPVIYFLQQNCIS